MTTETRDKALGLIQEIGRLKWNIKQIGDAKNLRDFPGLPEGLMKQALDSASRAILPQLQMRLSDVQKEFDNL